MELNKNVAGKKLTQIFRYLQALNQLRNPVERLIDEQPWVLWLHNLPDHPTIIPGDDEKSAEDFLLKVQRAETTNPPSPPKELLPWLLEEWQDINGSINPKSEIHKINPDGEKVVTLFEDDPARVTEWEKWAQLVQEWRAQEVKARQSLQIFRSLYELYSRLEREGEQYEIILGDGILHWVRSDGNNIKHPLLLQRIHLSFDPLMPEFTITATEHLPELYVAILRVINEVSASAITHAQQDLDTGHYYPLGLEETTEFFQRLITQLSVDGVFTGEGISKGKSNVPQIGREPVIFIRKRNLGFSAAIETILEDLAEQQNIPGFLQSIVGIEEETNGTTNENSQVSIDPNGEDEEILLCKEANSEQLQIAKYLETRGAVMVQGPPGTGKTHTIANLLGHFLAEGKSVLVTSHTSKALRVLKDQVVAPLKPLCVSVLSDESRKQMESSIDTITEKLSIYDAEGLEQRAKQLTNARKGILESLRKNRERLKLARMDEYRSLVVAGAEYSPSVAARMVDKGKGINDWIPSPVQLGAPLSLSDNEVVELYVLNSKVTPEDEKEFSVTLPNPNELLTPVDFDLLVQQKNRLLPKDLDYRKDLWDEVELDQEAALKQILSKLSQNSNLLDEDLKWKLEAIDAGRCGGKHLEPWDNLVKQIEELYHQAVQSKEIIYNYGPFIPEKYITVEGEKIINNILQHITEKGKIGKLTLLVKGQWKQLINSAKVNNEVPSSLEHFKALHTLLELKILRKQLVERWKRQMSPLGALKPADLGEEPELVCKQYCEQIGYCLDWYKNSWQPLETGLKELGLKWDLLLSEVPVNTAENGDLLRIKDLVQNLLPPIIETAIKRCQWQKVEQQIHSLIQNLEKMGETSVGISNKLLNAVSFLDPMKYKETYNRLIELTAIRVDASRRKELIDRLRKVAPAWAGAIRSHNGIHGKNNLPGNVSDAWLWRQLNDELDERSRLSMEELHAEIEKLRASLIKVTASLVESKAWAAQVRRTTLTQRQALQGWKQLMKKVGKGTGKRATLFLAEARKLMPVCQTAVPVWIMPLIQIVENFNPNHNKFDVVIIDEASQADVMALIALYMGKQVIIVGDDEQVSPTAAFQRQDEVQKLIEAHLAGVPNSALYDGMFSIYDLAKTSYQPICLREHFRCVSPIIQFSNYLSYEGKIRPLRDESQVQIKPPTVAYRVEGVSTYAKINKEEGQAIVSLLLACMKEPEYKEATFGVISMVGDQQAAYIDSLLQKYLSAYEYTNGKIQCGNSAQFQGDERDVIFISMVDSSKEAGVPLTRKTEGYQDLYKKRFNVAASRARDQLWVVYSMDPETELKEGDLRKRLIRHALDPNSIAQLIERKEVHTESEFEKQVLRRLMQAGYKVTPQWKVGSYRIDMVVEGGGKRLAVECDGDKYHTLENLTEDMNRQAILERLGWKFVRIRGSQFFRDPDKAMQIIYNRLNELEIPPELEATSQSTAANETLNNIIRRADQIYQDKFVEKR